MNEDLRSKCAENEALQAELLALKATLSQTVRCRRPFRVFTAFNAAVILRLLLSTPVSTVSPGACLLRSMIGKLWWSRESIVPTSDHEVHGEGFAAHQGDPAAEHRGLNRSCMRRAQAGSMEGAPSLDIAPKQMAADLGLPSGLAPNNNMQPQPAGNVVSSGFAGTPFGVMSGYAPLHGSDLSAAARCTSLCHHFLPLPACAAPNQHAYD